MSIDFGTIGRPKKPIPDFRCMFLRPATRDDLIREFGFSGGYGAGVRPTDYAMVVVLSYAGPLVYRGSPATLGSIGLAANKHIDWESA